MQIVQIISEHKRKFSKRIYTGNEVTVTYNPVKQGYKRVQAIVDMNGYKTTKHIEILKT